MNDAFLLFRDMGADVASKVADKARPDQEALDNIDEPEDENTWHENPDTGGLKDKIKSNIPSRGGLKDAAKDAKNSAQQSGDGNSRGGMMQGLKGAAQTLQNKGQENMSEEDQEKARQKKEETKQKAHDRKEQAKGNTKQFFEEKIPKERREQTVYRLKKMIVEIQGHSDCTSRMYNIV